MRAADSARPASLRDYGQGINPTGRRLARRDGTRLDDTAGGALFLGIGTIQERGRGMVPLYAARVQDLGPGNVVVVTCGACGHTAELPLSALIHGLVLQPGFR